MKHIVVTRMLYTDNDRFFKRLELYKKYTLKSLKEQSVHNFDIAVLCNRKHKEAPINKSKKEKDGFLCIKNTLPTGNIGYGTDLIFEPGETKCIKAEVAERIIKNSKGFICE